MPQPEKQPAPVVDLQSLLQSAMLKVERNAGLKRTRQRTFSYAELHQHKDDVQTFLIPDLLPSESVAVLIGEDGIGKTQLMSQLAACIALKLKTYLTLPINVKHGRALIVATEDGRQKFTNAITRITYSLSPKHRPEDVGIHFTEGSDFDDFTELGNEIEDFLKDNETDLIVVDALSDIFALIDGDINSSTHARKILNFFQYLCNQYKCALVVIHHATKTRVVEMRKDGRLFIEKNYSQGAGAITQKPRTVLALSSDPASSSEDAEQYTNYFHVVKANLMGKYYMQNALQLTFNTSTLIHTFAGKVNVELTTQELRASNEAANGGNRTANKPKPHEISAEQHKEILARVFGTNRELKRTQLIENMQTQYGVGKLKIEQSGGYIEFAQKHGWIQKVPDGFALTLPRMRVGNLEADEKGNLF